MAVTTKTDRKRVAAGLGAGAGTGAGTGAGSSTLFRDDADGLSTGERALVQAAMSMGLTEFTVPTPGDDHQRTNWRVRTWLTMRDGTPVAFLVASQELFPDFEIVGPEVTVTTGAPGAIQRR